MVNEQNFPGEWKKNVLRKAESITRSELLNERFSEVTQRGMNVNNRAISYSHNLTLRSFYWRHRCVVPKPFTTWSNFLEIMINHWPTSKTNTTYVISGHQRLTFGSQINQPPTCSLDVGVAKRKSILAHTAFYLKIRIIHVEAAVIKTDNLILIMTPK